MTRPSKEQEPHEHGFMQDGQCRFSGCKAILEQVYTRASLEQMSEQQSRPPQLEEESKELAQTLQNICDQCGLPIRICNMAVLANRDSDGSFPRDGGDEDYRDLLKAWLSNKEREAREIFVPVKGAEGYYEVSNTGKVRSVKGGRRKGGELKQSLRTSAEHKGYYIVTLVKYGKSQTTTVHRLVAKAFLSNPEDKPCVNHIDGDKLNNDVVNLEWATYAENEQHSFKSLGKVTWNKDTAEYETKPCAHCGKPFTARLWRKRRFCSKSCGAIERRLKELTGVNHKRGDNSGK